MIKLSTMTSVSPDWSLDEIVAGMKRHGYDGLEPRTGWRHKAGIELDTPASERTSIKARLADEGLVFSCIATGAKFAVPNARELLDSIQETRKAIDLAADLGAPIIRTFGGSRGAGELHWIVKRTADAYREVVDYAAQRRVTILMETHDEWCVSAQVRAVVEEVDHPNLRVLWDIMHPQRFCERPEETMANIGELTAHLHAHDGVYDKPGERVSTLGTIGEGIFDHATPLKLLSEIGFDGFFSLEIINSPGSDHDPDAVLKACGEAFRHIVGELYR